MESDRKQSLAAVLVHRKHGSHQYVVELDIRISGYVAAFGDACILQHVGT